MQLLVKLIAIAAPIVLGVLGAAAAFSPAIAESRWRRAWIAGFIVIGCVGGFATYRDSEFLRGIITGGDNYCFLAPATNHFGPDGQVQLVMTNRGNGAVIQIRYWIYESQSPVGPDDAAYNEGKGGGLPWSNPGSIYRLPVSEPQGQYTADIEALNGLVIEKLEIVRDGIALKYALTLTRGNSQIYGRKFDGTEQISDTMNIPSLSSLGPMSLWPWSIIFSATSLLVGGSALGVITWVNILRPRRRRKKLHEPVDAMFVIPAPGRACDYAAQDSEEHQILELVLPAHAYITVHLVYKPRLAFRTTQVYFGCNASENGGAPPECLEYFNTFITKGRRVHVLPGETETDDYVDTYGFYHTVEERFWSVGGFASCAFKIRTHGIGVYSARTFFIGDEVLGEASLTIRVEEIPCTPMRCVIPEHRNKACSKQITPLPRR